MRLAFLAAALALAACSPSTPTGGGQSAESSSAFPNLTGASYRAEGTIQAQGQTLPIVMIRSGDKMRMEVASPQGQSIIVTNGDSGESFILTNAGGRQMAMRLTGDNDSFEDPAAGWGQDVAANATRTGSCSAAGESGAEWTRTDEDGATSTACVTSDGVILQATRDGQAVWQTNSVQRGPQSADLFALPPGVEMLDLNNIPGLAEAIERAKGAGR